MVTISSYMKENGEAYLTQRQLANDLGVHRDRINRHIGKLLDYRYNGKPIITRELRDNGGQRIQYIVFSLFPKLRNSKVKGKK